MTALTNQSFKFAINVFWVTSREADDCCWAAVLGPQREAVREYAARVARGEAMPHGLEHLAHLNDLIDHWLGLFARRAHDASTRGSKSTGGVTVPTFLSDDLVEVWNHVRGTQHRAHARTLARTSGRGGDASPRLAD